MRLSISDVRQRTLLAVSAILLLCPMVVRGADRIVSINGIVVDPHGESVPYATVILTPDSLSEVVVAHTVTDPKGAFVLRDFSLSSDTAWLTVRSIGYRKRILPVCRGAATGLLIRMEEAVEEIPEVIVRGISPDVYAKGDTVVYSSRNYRIGHEKSMSDIVSRMPGIQIDPSGLVSFQGHPINKLLVNGADVLTGAVSSNLETFAEDFADQVEVITDYDDGSIDRTMQGEKKVALNLKTKKSLRINGWLDLAGGVRDKYSGAASLISVIDKVSITGKINANNNGTAWISWGDYNNLSTDSRTFGGRATRSIIYNADEAEMIFPNANMYERRGGAGILSFIWMPATAYRIELDNTLHRSGSRKQSLYDQLFLQDNSASLHNEQVWEEARRLSFGAHQLTQRWIPSRHFSIESKTRVEYTDGSTNERSQNKLSSAPGTPLLFTNLSTRGYISLANGLEIKGVAGKALLYMGNTSTLYRDRDNTDWESNDEEMGGQPFASDAVSEVSYRLATSEHYKSLGLKNYLGVALPVLSGQILRTELRYNRHQSSRSLMQGESGGGEEALKTELLSLYAGLMKNQGALIYNLSVEGGWQALTNTSSSGLTGDRRGSPFFFAPRVEIGYRPTSLHRLLLTSSYDTSPYSLAELSLIGYRSSYRGRTLPSEVQNPFRTDWESSLEYSYSDLRKKLFLNADLGYSVCLNSAMSNLSQEGIRYTLRMVGGGRRNRLRTHIGGSYSLPYIPLDLQMSAGYTWGAERFVFDSLPDRLDGEELSVATTFQSRFRSSPVNARVRVSFVKTDQEYRQRQWHHGERLTEFTGQILGHCGKLSGDLSVGHQWMVIPEESRRFIRVGFTLRYSSERLVVELVGKDLTHLRESRWITREATTEYLSTTLYRQMPGCLLLSLRYKL